MFGCRFCCRCGCGRRGRGHSATTGRRQHQFDAFGHGLVAHAGLCAALVFHHQRDRGGACGFSLQAEIDIHDLVEDLDIAEELILLVLTCGHLYGFQDNAIDRFQRKLKLVEVQVIAVCNDPAGCNMVRVPDQYIQSEGLIRRQQFTLVVKTEIRAQFVQRTERRTRGCRAAGRGGRIGQLQGYGFGLWRVTDADIGTALVNRREAQLVPGARSAYDRDVDMDLFAVGLNCAKDLVMLDLCRREIRFAQ